MATYAQRRQQELFRTMGTLARNRANLETLARPYHNAIVVSLTPLQQRIIDAAAYVMGDLMKQVSEEMQHLPSKKNKQNES